jgi:hypothetical protein
LPKGILEFIELIIDGFIMESIGLFMLPMDGIMLFIPMPGIILFMPFIIPDIMLPGPPMPLELPQPLANVANGKANNAAIDTPVISFVSLVIFVCVLLIACVAKQRSKKMPRAYVRGIFIIIFARSVARFFQLIFNCKSKVKSRPLSFCNRANPAMPN